MAEALAQNADDYAVYGNQAAPDTSLETDYLLQFAETAEGMVDTQVPNSKIEYAQENQPHTTQLAGDIRLMHMMIKLTTITSERKMQKVK